jgi:PhzF family phenazine biosynthesis protein
MRVRIVDAFTDRPFAGNPAAVCLLDAGDWPDEGWMRSVAAELGVPMTAFARPLPDGAEADWAMRWFTPVVEERLCGHATLAAAHVLHSDRGAPISVRFTTLGGILAARTDDDGLVTLDFPAATVTEVPAPAGLVEALGAAPEATYATGALRDVVAVFADEATVRNLTPDLAAVAALARRDDVRGVVPTAPAAGADGGYDFVSRFFSPADGTPEDPATGSAHTALGPYWAARLRRDELVGLQVSARTGLIRTSVHGDRVHLTGRAVTVLDGALEAAPPA